MSIPRKRIDWKRSRLDTRLHIVEASTPQPNALPAYQDALAPRIAPERAEPPTWVNRGTHFAADMMDLALRTVCAIVDGEGANHHG